MMIFDKLRTIGSISDRIKTRKDRIASTNLVNISGMNSDRRHLIGFQKEMVVPKRYIIQQFLLTSLVTGRILLII